VFLLSGTANVILFTTTRRILPPKSIVPGRFVISQPKLVGTTIEDDPEAYYRGGSMEKVTESNTSIFKRTDSFVSDSGSERSIPHEHNEEPVQQLPELPYVQTPVTARPHHHQYVRESGESMYDMYAESVFRRSEMPHPTEDDYRHAHEDHPLPPLYNVQLDDNYSR
jgi:hypothetical protein